MSQAQKAVIFDYSTLLVDDAGATAALATALTDLGRRGLRLIAFSTHNRDLNAELAARGLPRVDLLVTRSEVGAAKGSPRWIGHLCDTLGVPAHRLFYVGDDEQDWRTAINSGVMYLHATWAKAKPDGVTALTARSPAYAHKFITHFFIPPPRWGYVLEDSSHRLHVRCLLNATSTLAGDSPARFTLQDVFTYENRRLVGGSNARDLLMVHVMSNLYAEGMIDPGTRFAVYPSSTPGKKKRTFNEFLSPAAKFFHGWLKEDMLVRAAPAPDTSMLRANNRHGEVSFLIQTNSVIVDQALKNHFHGRNVIVFDDFTTSGMSLEWGRILLYAAGAARVTLVTFGKYGQKTHLPHHVYEPVAKPIDPFMLTTYTMADFATQKHAYAANLPAMRQTQQMFECWKADKPFGA
jgi:hypothetical protein